MRSTHVVFGIAIHGARGALPWVGFLALVSALAWTMSVGVSDLPPVREIRASNSGAQSPTNPLMSERGDSTAFQSPRYGSSTADSCDLDGHRLLYVGLNSWIPAKARVAACPDGA